MYFIMYFDLIFLMTVKLTHAIFSCLNVNIKLLCKLQAYIGSKSVPFIWY